MDDSTANFTDYLETSEVGNLESNAVDVLDHFWREGLPGDSSQMIQTLALDQDASFDSVMLDGSKVASQVDFEYKDEIGDAIEIYTAIKDYVPLYFDKNKKKFVRNIRPITVADVAKFDALFTEMYQTRFQILFQRARRHKSVVLWTRASDNDQSDKLVIQLVDAVSISTKGIQHLIGNLAINRQGELCIQGTQLELVLDLQKCKIHKGIYCDGHVALVSGTIKLPENFYRIGDHASPIWYGYNQSDKDDDFDYFSGDVFGGNLDTRKLGLFSAYRESLLKSGSEISSYWVILSNVNFTHVSTLAALETLFQKIVDSMNIQPLPIGFIFMGDFSSHPFSFSRHKLILDDQDSVDYKKGFEDFSLLLSKYKILLEHCFWIFIPGPGDACICNKIVPRMPILEHYTKKMKDNLLKVAPNAKIYFTTSPCRIRHMDRKLIFFSNTILGELLSSSLFISDSDEKILSPKFLVKMLINTLIGQAHLYPTPQRHKIISKLDSFQLLCPLPDFICLGDVTAPCFVENVTDKCIMGNTGTYFSTSKTFFVYNVLKNKLDKYSL